MCEVPLIGFTMETFIMETKRIKLLRKVIAVYFETRMAHKCTVWAEGRDFKN